ncbi:MAG TPA: sortase [Patescibacteria group bacterium]|nr:sortase [Patescibacteria group bacterium]
MVKGLSLLLLGFGVFVLMQVAMPFISFKAWEIFSLKAQQALIDPAPVSANGNLSPDFQVENIGDFPAFIAKNKNLTPPYYEFKLSIPKIGLDPAPVLVYSSHFEENLAHLPGSALPGEKGNAFITGHSMLPNLAPKGTKAFFAKLPEVKKGDDIIVDALGQRYVYKVTELKIVDPKDISVILPPESNGRYISLMTCVPPGFNTKRLIVVAKLSV